MGGGGGLYIESCGRWSHFTFMLQVYLLVPVQADVAALGIRDPSQTG
jgi:hypothetical protein